MIKAEVITHEGNNRPTWFERCKSILTPTTLSVFVAVLAITVVLGATLLPKDAEQGSVTTPAVVSESDSLKVTPLESSDANEADSVAPLQPVTAATPGTSSAQPNGTSNPSTGSTPQTPSFNAIDRPVDGITANPTYEQSQLGGSNLTNTLQSTINGIKDLVTNLAR